uniref:3-hydroxyacyl-CoA dehydrogenase NAD binding domain-containing protein n=1 Tax=Panagrolaimus sp. PS1159 TaxID=55785 RepID=A0AC35EW09_9BILA
DKKTQFALPEILLGLIPGAGGTQRLPQIISLTNALEMILTGKPIKPVKAKEIGLIDEILEPLESDLETHQNLENFAIQRAKEILNGTFLIQRFRPLSERITNFFLCRRPLLDTIVLRTAKNKIFDETKGNYPAPLKILESIRIGLIEGNEKGFEFEAKTFAKLSKKIGIVGAGITGIGIAKVSIDKGIKVILLDISNEAIETSKKEITKYLEIGLERKRYTKSEYDKFLASLTFTTSYNEFQDVEIVFEAIGKNLSSSIINEIVSNVSESCIIASTTSRFSIEKLFSETFNRERTIGMHYINPIEKTQILEVITSNSTSEETFKTLAKFGLIQKKLIVPLKNYSFLIRCLIPLAFEIVRSIQEGYSPVEIDDLTKSAAARNLFRAERIQNDSMKLLEEMIKAGFLGRKTRLGFYDYNNPQRPQINNDAIELIKRYKSLKPNETCSSTTEECKMRILSRFINEACLCFDEGIVASPANGDIASVMGLGFPPFKGGPFRFIDSYGAENLIQANGDIASVMGLGFPPFKGGPFRFIDSYGAENIIQVMERFGNAYSKEEFTPAKILQDYAKTGKLFYPKHEQPENNKL